MVLLGVLVAAVAAVLVVYFVGQLPHYRALDEEPDEDEALVSLREAYLAGEITEEEYERTAVTLQGEHHEDEDVG